MKSFLNFTRICSACNPREAGDTGFSTALARHFLARRAPLYCALLAQVLVDQKFPNRDYHENGQSDSIPNDAGLADFFLFDHALRFAANFT
jgi:hypothetical protein